MSKLHSLDSSVLRYIKSFIALFETLIIIGLAVLVAIAFVFFIKDLLSLRFVSVFEEINIVFSSISMMIVLIELLRTFVVAREKAERYIAGFLEVGIIILIREIAISAIAKEVTHALMASGGALLLVLALFIYERWCVKS